MTSSRLAAPILSLVLLAGAAVAGAPPRGPMTHFTDISATAQTFVRMPHDPDAATIRLDTAAIAQVRYPQQIFEIEVNYDDEPTDAWRAERDFEPRFDAILGATNAQARLIATSLGKYRRSYFFAIGEDEAPFVTAFRRVPQPPGAAIAVIRSNAETLDTLKPTAAELAAAAHAKH